MITAYYGVWAWGHALVGKAIDHGVRGLTNKMCC